jgi:eukaryotic-like serine/threonine-protein kinase
VAAALSADPASPAAALGLGPSPRSRVVSHGRHRLGRPGTRPVSRIALAALTAIVAMLSVAAAAPATPPVHPLTAVADVHDAIHLSAAR